MRYCTHCGAEIADEAEICIKCGCFAGATVRQPESKPKLNVCALVGFILSICSMVIPYIGLGTGLAGVILSGIALGQIRKTDAAGKGFAIAGLVVGIVGCILQLIICIWAGLLMWLIAAIITAPGGM